MTRLKGGMPAPNFQVTSLYNEDLELSALKGKKVMVSFYRYASCPMCNLRIHELIGKYDNWSKNDFEMIAVFQSPDESLKKYVGKQDAPFPIVGDPNHKLYKAYGVQGNFAKLVLGSVLKPGKLIKGISKGFHIGKIETDITMIPADFLIDQHGVIHTAYYGKDASDHIATALVDSFLNQSS